MPARLLSKPNPVFSFLAFTVGVTLLLVLLKYGGGASFLHDSLWYILLFVFALTLLSLLAAIRGSRQSAESVVIYVLGGTVARLLLSVIAIYLTLRAGISERLEFVLNFMAVYFVFLAFEIYSLLTTLRANFENPT